MTAAITINDEERAKECIELRDKAIRFAEDGGRVFCRNRRGAGLGCVSGFIASVTLDHIIFDVVGKPITIQLASIIELHEHFRKLDPVVRIERVERRDGE